MGKEMMEPQKIKICGRAINLIAILLCISCDMKRPNKIKTEVQQSGMVTNLKEEDFNTTIDGKSVKLYWIQRKDLKMAMTNYGGRIISLFVPDKRGNHIDVNIGRGSIKEYIESPEAYFGATIGRWPTVLQKVSSLLTGTNIIFLKMTTKTLYMVDIKGFKMWFGMLNRQTNIH